MTLCSVVRDAQHHLAAVGDTGEGRALVLEQKDRVDRRFQLAGVRESRELDELRAARLDEDTLPSRRVPWSKRPYQALSAALAT